VKLTVRSKLLSVIVLLMLTMAGLSTFLLMKLEQSNARSTAMLQQDFRNASVISNIDSLLTRSDINILRMIAIGDPASVAQWKEENERRLAEVDRDLNALRANSDGVQDAAVANLQRAYHRMQVGMKHQVERIEAGDIKGGAAVNRLEVKDNANQVYSILADMRRNLQASAQGRVNDNLAAMAQSRYLSIGIATVVSLVALALGLYVVHAVTVALRTALRVANQIADGKLGNEITSSVRDETGQLLVALGKMDLQLQRMVYYDPLTSLPNRTMFHECLRQMIADSALAPDRLNGVMMIDIDRFKGVNDTLGHAMGDQLLCEVSGRLRAAVQPVDTVSRLGGDEFAILVPDIGNRHVLEDLARRIIDKFDECFVLAGNEVFVSCSVGLALYPTDSFAADDLMKYADSAMYLAKRAGRRGYRFYSKDLTIAASARLALESELRRAIERNELELHFQPKVKFRENEVIGSEALLRWRRPGVGLVPPVEFIPVAEETGLIVDIGEWVLREACRAAVEWNAEGFVLHKVAVNLSARQFQSRDLPGLVGQILVETGCLPEWLELEITESLLLTEDDTVLNTLSALRSLGLSIAIDDFGTGYSSLSYLARFPIDTLKIDKSFVQKVTTDLRHAELVKAILSIAACLGQRVVAEGVETADQAAFLEENGCQVAQGFLFSRPLPKSDMELLPRYLQLAL
jgi:diguanylate cyclase (GGDEF)-like protein